MGCCGRSEAYGRAIAEYNVFSDPRGTLFVISQRILRSAESVGRPRSQCRGRGFIAHLLPPLSSKLSYRSEDSLISCTFNLPKPKQSIPYPTKSFHQPSPTTCTIPFIESKQKEPNSFLFLHSSIDRVALLSEC